MPAAKTVFWASAGLLVYSQLGYPVVLLAWARARRPAAPPPPSPPEPSPPAVSLIVAAHDEEAVIGAKVADALALD